MKTKKQKQTKTIEEEMHIVKVWEFSSSGQKCVTIPKDSKIKVGDYVVVKKAKDV
jgi:sporulation protein YlmC with PRC-barrel domain